MSKALEEEIDKRTEDEVDMGEAKGFIEEELSQPAPAVVQNYLSETDKKALRKLEVFKAHEKLYKELKVGKILHSYSPAHLFTTQEKEYREMIINLMEEYRHGSYAYDLREILFGLVGVEQEPEPSSPKVL